jgi:hypothetical protein
MEGVTAKYATPMLAIAAARMMTIKRFFIARITATIKITDDGLLQSRPNSQLASRGRHSGDRGSAFDSCRERSLVCALLENTLRQSFFTGNYRAVLLAKIGHSGDSSLALLDFLNARFF